MRVTGKDGAIDQLLRAHFRRLQAHEPCSGFDVELAAAYLEGGLKSEQIASYELHLSRCASCRANLVRLASLAEAGKKVGFRPGWAVGAAAAVIVFLISLSALMWRQIGKATVGVSPARAVKAPEHIANEQAAPTRAEERSARPAAPVRARAERQRAKIGPLPPRVGIEIALSHMPAPEAPPSLPKHMPNVVQAEAAPEPAASESESQPAEPTKPNIVSGRAAELERAQQHESIELNTKKDDGGVLATIKNAFALIPKLPSKVAGLHRLIAPYSYRSLTGPAEPNERKSSETARKIGNKRFKLSGSTWIDDEYESNKGIPPIVVIRDGSLYRELISGSDEMKLYLTGIPNEHGAIIVYKGKVYKLLPRE
jgi:hypothetical protein